MAVSHFLLVAVLVISFSNGACAAEKTMAVWSDGHTSTLSDEELIRYALASPGPPFPEEAQKKKVTGSGLYELRINKAGATTDAVAVKSKPAIFRTIRVPVSRSVNRVH